MPSLARPVVARARLVICASSALAGSARELGARDVRVIPSGVDVPAEAGERRPSRLTSSTSAGSRRRRGSSTSSTRPTGCRSSSSATGRSATRCRRRSASCRTPSSAPYFDAAAVVAVPSRREGYGVVCAEAMAHGKPVVASAVGGLLDLVRHGETGLLVPPGDAAGLREALRWLLGDPELRSPDGRGRAGAGAGASLVGARHRRDAARLRGRAREARVAADAGQDRLLGRRGRARVDARRLPARGGAGRAPAPAAGPPARTRSRR